MKITKITNTSLAAQGALAHHLERRLRRIHDNANFAATGFYMAEKAWNGIQS